MALLGKEGFTQPILGQKTAGEPCYPQIPYTSNLILECTHIFLESNLNSINIIYECRNYTTNNICPSDIQIYYS